jgi:GNAT superfamily N-acetyltransferase
VTFRIRRADPWIAAELADFALEQWDEAYRGILSDAALASRRAEPAASRRARWEQRVEGGGVLVAEEPGGIVGVVRSEDIADPRGPLLSSLVVSAAVRSRGIGAALVAAAVGDDPAHLWVFDGARRAQRFHERQGFRFDGARRLDTYGLELRMVRGHAPRAARA